MIAPESADSIIDLIHLEPEEEDTVPAVHLDAPELQHWLDSTPDRLDSASAPLDLTLRPVGELPVLVDVAPVADTLPPGVVLRADDDPAATPTPTTLRPAGRPAITKAERRAAVRRRRLSSHPPAVTPAPGCADVLVLEGNERAREQLCGLLETFGFRVHPVPTAAQAAQLLDAKHFVAAFLDIAFDEPEQSAGIELCQRVKAEAPAPAGRGCALVIVSGSTRPVERVRATLAGGDAFLLKPVTRGSVAQALEACRVALPADSRRA